MLIRYSEKSNRVKELQIKLKVLGYNIKPDGDFGNNTLEIVKEFQKDYNLKQDGIVGPKTLSIIDYLIQKQSNYENPDTGDDTKNHLEIKHFEKSKFIWILDPGHGGLINGNYVTPGKRSPQIPPGIYEGVTNRKVANRLSQYCEDNEISYINIVPEDTDIKLSQRVERANKIYRRYKNCIYVSIHCNASGNGASWNEANGIETYYYKNDNCKSVAENIQEYLISQTGARDRGVKKANFYVLRKTLMSAILLELGFMTNLEEARKLADDDYIDILAFSIANGIKKTEKEGL